MSWHTSSLSEFDLRKPLTTMKMTTKLVILITAFIALGGVAQANVMMAIATVPDAGTTSVLMGVALAGLAVARRYIR
jgi:VPDSG-CTERM motif